MNPVNWFEIPVLDMQRARSFYQRVFGVQMQDMEMPGLEMVAFPWEQGGANATGALIRNERYRPVEGGVIVYFQCDDVAETMKRVPDAGGAIVSEKQSIGEYGFIAMARDSEGNVIGMHSLK